MTKQLSITLDDELDAEIRASAGGNISEWMAAAARERLTRELWAKYKIETDRLGINDPEVMASQIAIRDEVQRAFSPASTR